MTSISPHAVTSSPRILPLTPAQESLYVLNQLTGGLPVYHMPQAFRLRGRLNIDALRTAIAQVVQHHPALRARIKETPEGPVQWADTGKPFALSISKIHLPELDAGLQEIIARPFDLAREEPFRAHLFELASDDHVLLFVLHHVVGDMSSLGILYRDLASAFEAVSKGERYILPTVDTDLFEYAAGTRERAASPESLQFWRDRLKNCTEELELPLDRSRPRVPSFRGDARYFELSADLFAGLNTFARKNRCSVYMVCLAALQVLVHRYTGQDHFTIATPFSDREDPALENTVGYLINLVPVPCEVRPSQTFSDLLQSVRATCLEVYEHHRISLGSILRELKIPFESPRPPLAQVVFQYFPEAVSLALSGLQSTPWPVHSRTSKFDLCFSIWESEGRATMEIEYDTDLFEGSSIERLARHFTELLRGVVISPSDSIASFQLMDAREQAAVLAFGENTKPYPRDATVHNLFEEQARRARESTALLYDGGRITYGELDRRSSELARWLQKNGVQAGDKVGICLDRSPELIVALLAILKAGGAFVPFDANYPRPRLDYMFSDSGVRLLITDAAHADMAPQHVRTLLLDQASAEISSEEGSALGVSVSAQSAAYVMYTSGSTGEPKGVVIPHRAIIRLVKNTDFASLTAEETFLAFAPVSFDASTLEIWGPLLNGAKLAIYPPQFESVEQLADVLERFGVTTLWLTAGLFNTVVDRHVQALRGVRQLLAGGDVLSAAHVRKAQEALPQTKLINGYGPTENTTFTCCFSIPRSWPADRPVPIGRPIANSRVYILDADLKPAPVGVPGDLYTGGDGLSPGYWNKPELTARNFIPDPFDTTGERKIYRTGDRARFLNDGTIEFLGRKDAQVKIRGFRIELGEVEAAFRQLAEVRDAVAVVRPDQAGGKTLATYIVLQKGAKVEASDLRQRVSALLPAHACPAHVLVLPELPLGPNGKVNRAALPAPMEPTGTDSPESAPENPVEQRLLQIFREILELPRVGIDDNFFHLGGESLRATRALSQINAAFNCRLGLPRLFQAPTVRQLAGMVQKEIQTAPPAARKLRAGALPGASTPDLAGLSEEEIDALLNQLLASHDVAES